MNEDYYIFILLALLSEVLGTISGFGSSILFVPLATLFFDFQTVLGITAVFHVFSNSSKIFLFRKGIDKEIAFKLGVPAIVFVVIGALLTTLIPVREMELFMSITLFILSFYLLINFNKKLKQSNTNLFVGGMLSGFLAGIAGTGGAIRGITLAAFSLPKEIFIATSAFIDLGVDSSRAIVYVSSGYFKREYLVLIPFLLLISILGSYLGKVLLKHISEKLFRYIVLSIIIITSLSQLLKYFW